MAVKAAPGRYKPDCPQCGRPFHLLLRPSEDASAMSVAVKAIQDEDVPAAVAAALGIGKPKTSHDSVHGRSAVSQAADDEPAFTPPPHEFRVTAPPPRALSEETAPPAPTSPPAVASGSRRSSAAPALAAAPSPQTAAGEARVPEQLGGYRIVSRLGSGGMGAVYLARQLSLDRDVAVKVMHPHWSRDPEFVARFTREAYAAAQLTHHNVVQIHDIGAERQTNYFSMEYVRGQNLAQLVGRDGKLDPEVAAGYILQAARALKFAHDNGMIHRDIKPDNLLLNEHGLVKVADLGLVKIPGGEKPTRAKPAGDESIGRADVTQANISMGTPAYMPPEQAADAAKVDARADIYALGCTFYHLLVGRPPFGGSAEEVTAAHARQPITPPAEASPRVPKALSAIVVRMTAKRPDDRYQGMEQVIEALEEALGVGNAVRFSPREEHVIRLEQWAGKYSGAPLARARGKIIGAFFGACFAALGLSAYLGAEPSLVGAMLAMPALAVVSHLLVSGVARKTHIYTRYRDLIFSRSAGDWVRWAIVMALVVAGLALSGGLLHWIALGAVGALLGAGLHFVIDRPLERQRADALDQSRHLLRSLRLRGLDEESLRHFVCRYAGRHWEEFHEALFGYEAKLTARARWGRDERGQMRPKFAAWRDPILEWIEDKLRQRHEDRQRRHLQHVEARRLEARGLSVIEAHRKARRIADEMVARAVSLREKSRKAEASPPPRGAPPVVVVKSILDGLEDDKALGYRRRTYLGRRVGGPLDLLLGGHLRFLLGVLVLAPFLVWLYQNRAYATDELKAMQGHRVDPEVTVGRTDLAIVTAPDHRRTARRHHLRLSFLPDWICDVLGSWNAGAAGALLIASALFRGKLMSLMTLAGAGLVLMGEIAPIPGVAGLEPPTVALVGGIGLVLLSILWLREID